MEIVGRLGRIGFYYSPLLILALAWEAMARGGVLPADLGPSPWQTLRALAALYTDGDLVRHAVISFWREFAGFASSCVIGTAVGVGMARVDWVRTVFRPIVTFARHRRTTAGRRRTGRTVPCSQRVTNRAGRR